MFKRVKVKKGDTVKVISGGSKGKQGTVMSVDRRTDRVKICLLYTSDAADEL